MSAWCRTSRRFGTCRGNSAADFEKRLDAYEAGNYAGALRAWKPFAKQGHAGARNWLGGMYYQGEGSGRMIRKQSSGSGLPPDRAVNWARHYLKDVYADFG